MKSRDAFKRNIIKSGIKIKSTPLHTENVNIQQFLLYKIKQTHTHMQIFIC